MFLAFVVAMGNVGLEDVAVAGFELFQDGGFVDDAGTAVIGECAEKNLSQLHYYPNQRGIYPVKQIIIYDYGWDNNLIVQSNFVEFLLLQTKGSCKRFFDFGCFVMLFNVFQCFL